MTTEKMVMGEPSMIQIPTAADLPTDMRPRLKPRLLKVKAEDIPRVLGWSVLVLPVAAPTETEGGIALAPDSIRHMGLGRQTGVVLAMGKMAFSERRGYQPGDDRVEVGDWVHFHENAGMDTLMKGADGQMVKIKYIPDRDLMAVLPNPEAFMVMV
jgi:co-chaperonin GroES (HSP10)